MKVLVKPIDLENQEKEQFAEAMCAENNCHSACSLVPSWNNSLNEEDDILF